MNIDAQKVIGPKHSVGFSLLELMVVLGILGVLLAVAFPNLQGVVSGQRLKTQSNETLTALLFAKSEAVKRRTTISICSMKTGIDNQCGTSGTEWANGWIVFEDKNANGVINNDDEIIKSKGDYNQITSKSLISFVVLTAEGSAQSSVDIEFCYSKADGNKARSLAMAALGQPVITSKANCS